MAGIRANTKERVAAEKTCQDWLVLPTIPQEGRDVEIVPADSRQGCHPGLTRWNVCVDADRLR